MSKNKYSGQGEDQQMYEYQQGLSIVGSSRRNGDRQIRDFYPTPPEATQALLDREKFYGNVWECACGDGAITKVLEKNGYDVISSDIYDYGCGYEQRDFITHETYRPADNIITNPPFKYALEFVERAKQSSLFKIAMFLKTVFLESAVRYSMFMDTEYPLKCMYQFSKRVPIYKNGIQMKNSGLVAYAWFVWDINYKGKPYIEWII